MSDSHFEMLNQMNEEISRMVLKTKLSSEKRSKINKILTLFALVHTRKILEKKIANTRADFLVDECSVRCKPRRSEMQQMFKVWVAFLLQRAFPDEIEKFGINTRTIRKSILFRVSVARIPRALGASTSSIALLPMCFCNCWTEKNSVVHQHFQNWVAANTLAKKFYTCPFSTGVKNVTSTRRLGTCRTSSRRIHDTLKEKVKEWSDFIVAKRHHQCRNYMKWTVYA